MHLSRLQLLNYKNYEEVDLDFASRINVLVGRNGSGKTNLLDAIYYLSFSKSAFSSSDQHCILHGQNFFMAKGKFRVADSDHEILGSLQVGSKKVFKEGLNDYEKLSEHIGRFPVVLIAPDDIELVKESSEARRKFFDGIIAQLDKKYLEELMQYNHVLKQRNSLLRMFQESGKPDWIVLESYDTLLAKLGGYIFEKRVQFVEEFIPIFQRFYSFLVDESEVTGLTYASELLEKGFEEGLRQSRQKDLVLQRTIFGIHRDDYLFTLGGKELKKLGSQGQQKSFVIALKLTQFEIIRQHKGFKPVLLLDDIFDKLDDFRIGKLLMMIKTDFGQTFISDARPDRTRGLLDQVGLSASVFMVDGGKVTLL